MALTAHTMAMFSIVTIYTVMCLILQSISNIDNREFPGVDDMFPPGPLGYQFLIYSKAISIVPIAMFLMNGWLADVLLVCSVSDSFAQLSNAGRSSSSIVATSSTLGTAGPSPSLALCTSHLWVSPPQVYNPTLG